MCNARNKRNIKKKKKEMNRQRTFKDMLDVVQRITAARPARCPENLEITLRLVKKLGLEDAMNSMKYVHIAGTKGKGTCSVYTSQLLRSYGRRVGLFTSPHLVDIRERIVVDGSMLPPETFARYFFDVYDRHQALLDSESDLDRDTAKRANFFRIMFLTSLHAFASEGVEISVMEVGIGGRIDATNVITPSVCGITSLGMDHMDILGDTIEAIAAEKAGIMKPGVPCFSVAQDDYPSTRKVLERRSREVDCPLVFMDPGVLPIRQWPRLSIGGEHAERNSKLALMLARTVAECPLVTPLMNEEIAALGATTYAGRSQVIRVSSNVTVFLDGAHTPESLEAASKWFFRAAADRDKEVANDDGASRPHRNVLLFYSTRDPAALFKTLMPYTRQLHKAVMATIHSPKVPTSGVTDDHKEHLLRYVESWRKLYPEIPCLPCAAPFEQWRDIEELVAGSTGELDDADAPVNIFVTGSFFLVGDVIKMISDAQQLKS